MDVLAKFIYTPDPNTVRNEEPSIILKYSSPGTHTHTRAHNMHDAQTNPTDGGGKLV